MNSTQPASPFYATVDGEERYFSSAIDAATWRKVAQERAQRDAARRAAYLARCQAAGLCPERAARSLALTVVAIGPDQYRVTGGAELHHVDLSADAADACDCGDYVWRGGTCKHLIACAAYEARRQGGRAA